MKPRYRIARTDKAHAHSRPEKDRVKERPRDGCAAQRMSRR